MTERGFAVTRTNPLAEDPEAFPHGVYETLDEAVDVARSEAVANEGGDQAWVVTEAADPDYEFVARWDRETERDGKVEPVAEPGAELIIRHRGRDGATSSMEWRRFLGDRDLADVAAATSARVEAWGGAEVPGDIFDEGDTRRWLLDDGTRVEASADIHGVSVMGVVVEPDREYPQEIPALAMIVGRAVVRTAET